MDLERKLKVLEDEMTDERVVLLTSVSYVNPNRSLMATVSMVAEAEGDVEVILRYGKSSFDPSAVLVAELSCSYDGECELDGVVRHPSQHRSQRETSRGGIQGGNSAKHRRGKSYRTP